MYGGRLESADEVCQHRLTDLMQVQETEETVSALCLVDTAGCDMGEEQDEAGSSFNQGEALVVREYLQRLLQAGITQEQIGVLTPYAAQVAALTPSSPILRPRLLSSVRTCRCALASLCARLGGKTVLQLVS